MPRNYVLRTPEIAVSGNSTLLVGEKIYLLWHCFGVPRRVLAARGYRADDEAQLCPAM